MMARNTNVPFKGRIQKRKTYHLQIITFRLQRAAGPYRSARRGLMHRSKWVALVDDFIGRNRESHRYVDAQRSGGLEVEDKFVFDRLHHWQLTRLLTLEDASHLDVGLTISIDDTSSIACQTASLGKFAAVVHDREFVARGN
jgi:hypothetical protein